MFLHKLLVALLAGNAFVLSPTYAVGVEALVVDDQEIIIQVSQDGSYLLTEKTTLSTESEQGLRQLSVQKIPLDLSKQGSEIIEVGIHQGDETRLLDLTSLRQPASAETAAAVLKFPELELGAKTWTKLRRHGEPGPGGMFAMDFAYGLLRLEKKGEVKIVSERPLYFQINDPGKVLAVEGDSGGFELKIRLTEPILSVGAETLRVSTIEDLRNDTPRVQVSTIKSWAAFAEALRKTIPTIELDSVAREELERVKAIGTPKLRAERILRWMGETASGDDKLQTSLALRMFEAVEIEAEPVMVGVLPDQDPFKYLRQPIDEENPLPSTNYFNHWALRFKDGDNWIVVDPIRGLGSASAPPYYFNHAWAVDLGSNPKPIRIELPDTEYAEATIDTHMVRQGDGEYLARSTVEFKGELANFLRQIYFKDGERALGTYLEAFASVSKHRGFMYRKINFFDRSSAGLKVEMTYSTLESKAGSKRTLIMPPHYLPFYSRPSAGLQFVAFPMSIVETTTVEKAFVAREEKHDCAVLGPMATIWRRVENLNGDVKISDRVRIPSALPPGETGVDQSRLSANATRLSQCAKAGEIIVNKKQGKLQPFSERMGRIPANSSLAHIRRIDALLEESPLSSELWRARGMRFREIGSIGPEVFLTEYLREADSAFRKAISLEPTNAEYLGAWGLNALDLNDLARAVEAFHKMSSLVSKTYTSFFLGGLVSRRTGRKEMAVGYFASAAANASDDLEKYRALSEQADTLCLDLKRCSESLPVHEKILQLEPQLFRRTQSAARAYADAGQLERAIELGRKALSLKKSLPARDELVKNLVEFAEGRRTVGDHLTREMFLDQIKLLNEALKLDRDNPKVLSLLVDVYAARAETEQDTQALSQAREYFIRLTSALPDDDASAEVQAQKLELIGKLLSRIPASQ